MVISQRGIDFNSSYQVLIRIELMIIAFFGFLGVLFTVTGGIVGFYGATIIGCAFARCDPYLSVSIGSLTVSGIAYGV